MYKSVLGNPGLLERDRKPYTLQPSFVGELLKSGAGRVNCVSEIWNSLEEQFLLEQAA